MNEFFDMECDLCAFKFTSLQHAKLHYFDEHQIIDGYLKCCRKKFKNLRQINDHLQFHQNPEEYKWVKYKISFRHNFNTENRTNWNKIPFYRCHLCDKVLPRKSDLRYTNFLMFGNFCLIFKWFYKIVWNFDKNWLCIFFQSAFIFSSNHWWEAVQVWILRQSMEIKFFVKKTWKNAHSTASEKHLVRKMPTKVRN